MALIKEKLKQELKVVFENASYSAIITMLEKMKEEFKKVFVEKSVDALATIIDNYIKSATVTVAPGISVAVTTAGTATNQAGTGATTSTGTAIIS